MRISYFIFFKNIFEQFSFVWQNTPSFFSTIFFHYSNEKKEKEKKRYIIKLNLKAIERNAHLPIQSRLTIKNIQKYFPSESLTKYQIHHHLSTTAPTKRKKKEMEM